MNLEDHKEINLYECEETQHERALSNKLHDASDWLDGLIEALYVTGNSTDINNCVEELQHILGSHSSVSQRELKVANKEENKIFNWALGYQRAYIDQNNNKKRSVENYL